MKQTAQRTQFPFTGIILALGALVLGLQSTAPGAEPEEPMLMTVGTVHEGNESGQTLAFLTWQETMDGVMAEEPVAIFRKEGVPGDSIPYERVAVVTWITDPRTIQSILRRANDLNDDIVQLEEHINELFGDLLEESGASASISLEEKISALLRTARYDPELRDTVVWLAMMHPVLNLCVGRAYADPISEIGPTTFEIRRWDPSSERSLEVIGRVTLDPQEEEDRFLPEPGPPVVVDVGSARSHLNVRLRWSEPMRLRDRAPLHYGFNIYRVEEDFATDSDRGWDERPPHPEDLTAMAQDPKHPAVVQVNQAPVLTDRVLDENQAMDMDYPEEAEPGMEPFYFYLDDNRRFHDGEAFEDGDSFYYFITARDIMRRDGMVSEGTHVIICSRIPPHPPNRVWVDNDYVFDEDMGEDRHHLAVYWENAGEADSYYLFRFPDLHTMQVATRQDYLTEDYLIAGPIPATEEEVLRYVDDGSGAATNASALFPTGPDDYGVPWLYTVRAAEDTACVTEDKSLVQGNLSGHGAPAWGVLRQRAGPDAANARIIPTLQAIQLWATEGFQDIEADLDVYQSRNFRISVRRHHPGIDWVEMSLQSFSRLREPFAAGHRLGRWEFGKDDDIVSADFSIPILHLQSLIYLHIEVGGAGLPSAPVTFPLQGIPGYEDVGMDGNIGRFVLHADVEIGIEVEGADPQLHVSHDPETGEIQCLDLEVALEDELRAAEWRVYRRIGRGELELVHQEMREPGSGGELTWSDCEMPARGGFSCYFVQALDDEGNPGPIARAGCVEIQASQELPTPMLYPVLAMGSEEQTFGRMTWFSSPEGVDRFEVLIASDDGPLPEDLGPDLSRRRNDNPIQLAAFPDMEFWIYDTGRVGIDLDGEAPEFTALVEFPAGGAHTILVRAVSVGPLSGQSETENRPAVAERRRGDLSNEEIFQWSLPPEVIGVTVPWPALSQIRVMEGDVGHRLEAQLLTPQVGAGVRIGEFYFPSVDSSEEELIPVDMPNQYPYPLPPGFDPNDGVFSLAGRVRVIEDPNTDRSLLPAVLYRYQLPNAMFPEVSGDLVQVSPLLWEIAFQHDHRDSESEKDILTYPGFPPDGYKQFNILQDPFVAARPKEDLGIGAVNTHDLYIVDNQPFIFGAKYRYLLVRLREDGEVKRVYPVPPLEIVTPEMTE